MLALAFAAAAALTASVTDADARAREIGASSYGFDDSLLPNTGLGLWCKPRERGIVAGMGVGGARGDRGC